MNQELIKHLRSTYGINVKKIEVIDKNDVFDNISYKLNDFFNRSPLKDYMKYELSEINTLVESKKGFFTLKHHPCITFSLEDGSHIRFSPNQENGIEITRVYVHESSRRCKIGTALMNAFNSLCYYSIGHLPNMTLECTGAIGFGKNQSLTPLNDQIHFFEQFGFTIKKKSKTIGYVLMEYKEIEKGCDFLMAS